MTNQHIDKPEIRSISAAQAKLLNEISVPISLELGEISLTGAQVVDLLAGQVFDFTFDADRPLALKVGAEPIAYARFVAEDERLALEIINVGAAPPESTHNS